MLTLKANRKREITGNISFVVSLRSQPFRSFYGVYGCSGISKQSERFLVKRLIFALT